MEVDVLHSREPAALALGYWCWAPSSHLPPWNGCHRFAASELESGRWEHWWSLSPPAQVRSDKGLTSRVRSDILSTSPFPIFCSFRALLNWKHEDRACGPRRTKCTLALRCRVGLQLRCGIWPFVLIETQYFLSHGWEGHFQRAFETKAPNSAPVKCQNHRVALKDVQQEQRSEMA